LQPDFASPADEPHSVVWVVDPLDGTTNFSLGLHVWGVSLARTVDGWTETGVLYFPLIDELYYAQQGQGAYLNGKSIHVCTPEASSPQTFFACCSRTHQRFQVNLPYKARILGSAAYTFCAVGRGIAILGFEATPKIWDLAAAWLVVKEAGGEIETYDESRPFPLRSQVDYARANFPTLAAATPRLLEKARRQIVPR
jgi:myo-inositol-1(or 4)-monophosphatase